MDMGCVVEFENVEAVASAVQVMAIVHHCDCVLYCGSVGVVFAEQPALFPYSTGQRLFWGVNLEVVRPERCWTEDWTESNPQNENHVRNTIMSHNKRQHSNSILGLMSTNWSLVSNCLQPASKYGEFFKRCPKMVLFVLFGFNFAMLKLNFCQLKTKAKLEKTVKVVRMQNSNFLMTTENGKPWKIKYRYERNHQRLQPMPYFIYLELVCKYHEVKSFLLF